MCLPWSDNIASCRRAHQNVVFITVKMQDRNLTSHCEIFIHFLRICGWCEGNSKSFSQITAHGGMKEGGQTPKDS